MKFKCYNCDDITPCIFKCDGPLYRPSKCPVQGNANWISEDEDSEVNHENNNRVQYLR